MNTSPLNIVNIQQNVEHWVVNFDKVSIFSIEFVHSLKVVFVYTRIGPGLSLIQETVTFWDLGFIEIGFDGPVYHLNN